jgi:coenzyme F420-reducing hydrogenase alpha subunit
MPQTIVIDTVTRIEGHAKMTLHLDDRGEEGEYREYSTDEQRSASGCSASRMYQDFGDATLGP